MVKLGASLTFEGDVCKITRNSKLLAVGETCGKLYVLKVIPEKDVNVAKEESKFKPLPLSFWSPWNGEHFKVDGWKHG